MNAINQYQIDGNQWAAKIVFVQFVPVFAQKYRKSRKNQ